MSKGISWLVMFLVAGLALAIVVCPDPFPIAIDDIGVALGAAMTIKTIFKKSMIAQKDISVIEA